jgi:hypothetical protein
MIGYQEVSLPALYIDYRDGTQLQARLAAAPSLNLTIVATGTTQLVTSELNAIGVIANTYGMYPLQCQLWCCHI